MLRPSLRMIWYRPNCAKGIMLVREDPVHVCPEQHAQNHPRDQPRSAGQRALQPGTPPFPGDGVPGLEFLEFAGTELRAGYEDGADIVLAACLIGGVDQSLGGSLAIAVVGLENRADPRRRQDVAQSVAAQQQRRIRAEADSLDLDELLLVGVARARPDVAKDFVPPRMLHRL